MSFSIAISLIGFIITLIIATLYMVEFLSSPEPILKSPYKPSEIMRFDNGDEVSLEEAVNNAPDVKFV